MTQIITDFLNSKIDYQTVLAAVGIYLLALWLMFCFWVFMDANKRYKKPMVATLMALLVFVFNFPALVFYLIIRPEQDDLADLMALDSAMQGGVQVPIVNFTGANGEVQLSLSLQIHPQLQGQSDMVVNVGWESNNPNMQVGTMPQQSRPTFSQQSSSQSQEALRKGWDSIREKAKDQLKNIHTTVNSTVASSVNTDAAEAPSDNDKAEKKGHKQVKNTES